MLLVIWLESKILIDKKLKCLTFFSSDKEPTVGISLDCYVLKYNRKELALLIETSSFYA